MNAKKEYLDLNKVSYTDRESFNNMILLLSMIKYEYYYIISFSRKCGIINIGFDYKSEYHEVISEYISVDFNSNKENVIIKCEIQNFNYNRFSLNSNDCSGNIIVANNTATYFNKIKKDEVFPLTINKLNEKMLLFKNEIIEFLEVQYKFILNN